MYSIERQSFSPILLSHFKEGGQIYMDHEWLKAWLDKKGPVAAIAAAKAR